MTNPAPRDALLAAVTLIRASLAARSITATVGTDDPSNSSDKPDAPFVLVAVDDATSRDRYATDERGLIRATVFSPTKYGAHELARKVYADLMAHRGDSAVRSCAPGAPPVPGTDFETGQPLSTFTVELRLRPDSL